MVIKQLALVVMVVFTSAVTAAEDQVSQPQEIPGENAKKGDIPSFDSAKPMAQAIVDAVNSRMPAKADAAFFPMPPFLALKKMPGAEKYYEKLRGWFANDLEKEANRLKESGMQVMEFKPGHCKWKEVGSEYNQIPYWSCYRSRIRIKKSGGEDTIEVRVMINWGQQWYVTHLGPIP